MSVLVQVNVWVEADVNFRGDGYVREGTLDNLREAIEGIAEDGIAVNKVASVQTVNPGSTVTETEWDQLLSEVTP